MYTELIYIIHQKIGLIGLRDHDEFKCFCDYYNIDSNRIMEDKHTEYKLRFVPSIIRDICAFLNTEGGKIYIGLNDKGDIIGVENAEIIINRLIKLLEKESILFLNYISSYVEITRDNIEYVIIDIKKKGSEEAGFVSIFNEKENRREYYFRVNDRTIRTDEEHALYWETVGLYDLPILGDYEPSDKDRKRKFKDLKKQNNVIYKTVNQIPNGNYLYKYMDLESALLSLDKRPADGENRGKNPNLRFVEPTSWDDQYEGRFYNAIFNGNEIDAEKAPFLYACCFSSKRENEAAWILYSHNRTGLASRCVEFTINKFKLREQLVKNSKKCSFYIGTVDYKNKEIIDNIHLSYLDNDKGNVNKHYNYYFKHFTFERYLELLLLKRTAFEHEREVRIFIIPDSDKVKKKTRRNNKGEFNDNEKPKSTYVNMDWIDVIDDIKIDKNCTDFEKALLQEKINRLVEEKRKVLTKEEYEKLKVRMQLRTFDPYKDDSLKQGPLQITTQNK